MVARLPGLSKPDGAICLVLRWFLRVCLLCLSALFLRLPVIKPKADKEDEDFRLRFIQSGIMKTPELSVFEAQKEIGSFGERIHRMFSMVNELLDTQDAKTFDKLYERIEKYEGISDNMEIEIAKYLDQVSDAHLSDDTKAKIRSMLRAISEIESIGDSCYNLARTIKRKGENKEEPECR